MLETKITGNEMHKDSMVINEFTLQNSNGHSEHCDCKWVGFDCEQKKFNDKFLIALKYPEIQDALFDRANS